VVGLRRRARRRSVGTELDACQSRMIGAAGADLYS
jgi:hypothetical protein